MAKHYQPLHAYSLYVPFPFLLPVYSLANPNFRKIEISAYPTPVPNQMNVTNEKSLTILTDFTLRSNLKMWKDNKYVETKHHPTKE